MYGENERAAVIYLKAEGLSDRAIGRMGELKMPNGEYIKLPSRDMVDDWTNPNHASYDEPFHRQYVRACEDSLWDEHGKLRELNKEVREGTLDPQAARIIADNIKWDLARRLRHIFGDKIDVTSKGEALKGTTIVVNSQEDKNLLEKI